MRYMTNGELLDFIEELRNSDATTLELPIEIVRHLASETRQLRSLQAILQPPPEDQQEN